MVTRRYWGLQGVTRGYKGLEGVARGYRGLQRIIYRNLFLTGCILHKTKRSQNFKFLTKTMDTLQKCQFCGLFKPMFFSFSKACLLYKTSKIVFDDLF